MAKTSGLLKSKRSMVLMYLFILTLVGIAIFALMYLYYQDKGLYTTDIEKYDAHIVQIASYTTDYRAKIIELDSFNNTIGEENEPNYSEQIADIDKMRILHEEAKLISTNVIAINEEILELDLDAEKLAQARSTIEAAYKAIEEHEIELKSLDDQYFVALYLLTLDNALKCYSSIDTINNSTSIEESSETCDAEIDSALSLLKENRNEFPKSVAYLNELKSYWDITVELNKTIEIRDEDKALDLGKKLEASSKARSNKQIEAETEFKQYIENLKGE